MLRSTERVPLEIVNRLCSVTSALTPRNAEAANRLTDSRMTSARPRLIQASVWRGSRAAHAVSRSCSEGALWGVGSVLLMGAPQSAFLSSTAILLANKANTISDT